MGEAMQASIGSLRPARQVQLQSSFQGLTSSFQRLHVATEARQHCVRVVGESTQVDLTDVWVTTAPLLSSADLSAAMQADVQLLSP